MKKRYISAILLIAAFFIVSGSSYKATTSPEEGFKNLKILPKDINKQQLDSVMANFAVSLGVRCNFCHAQWADSTKRGLDFASDDKEKKLIARSMMNMTSYLNTNYFNFDHSNHPDTIHAVVCYTCHRGTHEPDSRVFLSVIDSTIKSFHKR